MPSSPMQTEHYKTLPQVLIVGAVDVIGYSPSFTYEAQFVANLSAAAIVLATRRFDVVLNSISAERTEGLALPSLLLDLRRQCILSNLPVVIWYNAQEQNSLEWHARVAGRAGVKVLLFDLASANIDMNVACALLESTHVGPGQHSKNQAPSAVELMRALMANIDLRIVLQPQLNLQTGEIVGAEALARWNHVSKGNIAPATFVPLARQAGVELLLFHTVLTRVIALLSDLHRQGIAVPIAVNASASILSTTGIGQSLARRLREADVPTSLLTIELTEDVPVHDWLALSMELGSLRMWGFPIAMDDFGCGFASIDLLTQMPFSKLKIDGRFVQGMADDCGCCAAVCAAISIGQAMDLDVIAEGIESSSQVEALLKYGYRTGQGFALSLPLEVDEFIRALATGA